MTEAKKYIVFDWNGTLFDDAPVCLDTINHMLSSLGRAPIDMAAFHHHYKYPFLDLFLSMGVTEAEFSKLKGAFDVQYEPRVTQIGLRAGAREVLAFANDNGLHSIILSNHITSAIRTQLLRLDIDRYFSNVLAYADSVTRSSDIRKGERLRRYMEKSGHESKGSLIVGDSVEEIEIARNLSMIGVAITGGCTSEERLKAAKPDYLIHSLHELKPILEERRLAA